MEQDNLQQKITVEIIFGNIVADVLPSPVARQAHVRSGQWIQILAQGPGLTLGQKCATIIDDGEHIFHGLLPYETTDEEGVFLCAVDIIEESPVWKALRR